MSFAIFKFFHIIVNFLYDHSRFEIKLCYLLTQAKEKKLLFLHLLYQIHSKEICNLLFN